MSDLEKDLNEEVNVLQFDKEGNAFAEIFDEELDPIKLEFHYDGCVNVNCSGYEYLTLSQENLELMIYLIYKAEKYYADKFKKEKA